MALFKVTAADSVSHLGSTTDGWVEALISHEQGSIRCTAYNADASVAMVRVEFIRPGKELQLLYEGPISGIEEQPIPEKPKYSGLLEYGGKCPYGGGAGLHSEPSGTVFSSRGSRGKFMPCADHIKYYREGSTYFTEEGEYLAIEP